MRFTLDKKQFLSAATYCRKHIEVCGYGIEITKEWDTYYIWNVINQFTLGHEIELVGIALASGDIVDIELEDDIEEEFRCAVKGEETYYEGAVRYLTYLNEKLRGVKK